MWWQSIYPAQLCGIAGIPILFFVAMFYVPAYQISWTWFQTVTLFSEI
jgi:hypothetical protein